MSTESTMTFQRRMVDSGTFRQAKSAYADGENWHQRKLMFGPCCVDKIAKTLGEFAPYLIAAYNCLFLETQFGAAVVTCISDQGIRIEYFNGVKDRDYEWLRFDGEKFLGDADTERRLVPQPQER